MGSILGKKPKSTSTSTTTVDMPDWVEGPMKEILRRGMTLSKQPYEGFTGERIAGLTPDELQASALTRAMISQAPSDMARSQGITSEVARRGLEGFSQEELQPYMNPYIENVLDISRRKQFEDFDRAMSDYRGQAGQAGAFGGSRFGLGEAEMSRRFREQLGDFETQGLAQAFDQGMGRAMQGSTLAGQSAMDLANLAQLRQTAGLRDVSALEGIGGKERALQQAGLDIGYEDFLREQAYPYEQLQFASGLTYPAGGLMAGSTNTQTTRTSGGGPGILGAALGLGSMALGIPGVSGALAGGFGSAMSSLGMGVGGLNAFQSVLSPQTANAMGQGYLGLGPVQSYPYQTLRFARGGSTEVGGMSAIGQIANAMNSYFSGLRRRQPDATVDYPLTLEDGTRVLSDGTEIIEDAPIFEGGPTRTEYLDLWEKIQNGELPLPMPEDTLEGEGEEDPVVPLMAPEREALKQGITEDEDMLVRLMFGETRGEPVEGQRAVAYVALNRAKEKGKSLRDIILQPKQFSAFNPDDPNYGPTTSLSPDDAGYKKLLPVARDVLSEQVKDPSKGATHYYNPDMAKPDWGKLLESKRSIGAHVFGKTNFNKGGVVQYYEDGGILGRSSTLSPFQKLMQQNITNPLNTAKENLIQAQMRQTRSLGKSRSPLDFFTIPESEYYKEIPTPLLDNLIEDTQLKSFGDRLQRGQLPMGLQKAMSQVIPLSQRGGFDRVDLGSDAKTLMVSPTQKLLEQAAKVTNKPAPAKPQTQAKPTGASGETKTTTKSEEKEKEGFNIPLIMFGASLLTSQNDLPGSIGEGVTAAIATKLKQDAIKQEQSQLAAKNAMDLYKTQLYGKQVEAQVKKAESQSDDRLKNLKIQKLEKDISGVGQVQKQRIDVFSKIQENNPTMSADEAWMEAGRLVGASDAAVPQQSFINYEDYFNLR